MLICMFSVHVSEKTFFWEKQLHDSESHRPLHHFNIKAETLVNGVGFPPNAGLEFEHLRLVQDETVLEINTAYIYKYESGWKMAETVLHTYLVMICKCL